MTPKSSYLSFLTIKLLYLFFPLCISTDTLTVDNSITGDNLLVSEKGNFAFGFFTPGNSSNRYLGIWYHNIPGKTVVWVANRENPINGSLGVLSLNPNGNLELYNDHQNPPLWSTNISMDQTNGFSAQLLDSGNLILIQNETKRVIWQSFDYPTDTVLPGLKLGLSWKLGLDWYLTSWKSPHDPGKGDWSFRLDPTGCPQFKLLYKNSTTFWRSSPWPWAPMIPGDISSSANNKDEIYYTFESTDDESVRMRTVVISSGLIKRLSWDNNNLRWKELRTQPQYIYGHCGAYSFLNSNNVNGFECTCLPGFVPKSPKNWEVRDGSAGCKRERSQQMCRNGEGFVRIEKAKIPDTSIATLMNTNLSSSECRKLCLSNCSCKAYANLDIDSKGIGCVTWYGELVDTEQYVKGRDLYVRVDATTLAEYVRKKRDFLKRKGVLAGLVLFSALTTFLVVVCSFMCVRKKKTKVKKKVFLPELMENELAESMQPPDLPIFDLQSISAATDHFNPANKLGQGGFGSVYKGQLECGRVIAVKRLSQISEQGVAEFKNEVLLIARLQHRNLVRLLGCCIEGLERILIYEYLSNRSLDYFIFDHRRRPFLDWRKRFDIIAGIARGVLYLHHDSRLRVVHRDLKTSNVLLDADMNPKISDFGMARIFKGNKIQDQTSRVAGTLGYMAPEYLVCGKFSTKSDIFSFGVIMLEIISGKKSNSTQEDGTSANLIGHVWNLWKEGRVPEIVDPSLSEAFVNPEIFRCIQIGLLCVEEEETERPTMTTVLLMLNGETTLPCPKKPAFLLRKSDQDTSSTNQYTITEVKAR